MLSVQKKGLSVKLSAEPLGPGRRIALLTAAATIAMLAALATAARAQATENVYWDNFDAEPFAGIAFANVDGSGGGALNVNGTEIEQPEGMAFDPANGRIYITAQEEPERIYWVSVDGSGGGVLDTSGARVENPQGVTVDLKTQTVYWANHEGPASSIGYASATGGGGGTLNTAGAVIASASRPAIDTADNRIYWVDTQNSTFHSADLGGGGGSDLMVSEAPEPFSVLAINIDPEAGRLYYLDQALETIGWVNLSGVGGGTVNPGPNFDSPYGLAFDPSIGRFYWGNYGNETHPENAIGTVTLAGGAGGITPAGAPVEGPQDALVLKSPTGTGAPAVTQNVAALSCSQGGWAPDYPGSFVYGAPLSYSYQWLANGQAISGATGSSYTATAGGSYACEVTGKNQTGSGSQTSLAVTVTPAALTATLQTKKPHAKAGKAALVKFRFANGGQIGSAPVKVCAAKLTKKAKKGLVAPKCASVAALGSGGSAVATLSVKTKKSAKGTYKFTTQVKGATVKALTVSVKVTQPKKHKKGHKKK